jgi:hypothetical protein
MQPLGSQRSLWLSISGRVTDDFRIATCDAWPIDFSGWRSTIASGFEATFSPSFDINGTREGSTLELHEVELVVRARCGRRGALLLDGVDVRFRAALKNARGLTAFQLEGVGRSTYGSDLTSCIRSAVEDMFEQLASGIASTAS